MNLKEKKIAIIGLGYVGLPLAIEFGKKYNTIGFDINSKRVNQLNNGVDKTREVDFKSLKNIISSTKILNNEFRLVFTNTLDHIRDCNIYIVTVPTPIDKFKRPDLDPLFNASKMLGEILKKNDVVIYESTVYPGCTEEDCVPILEKHSGLKFNIDFYCGYSPERINPGDKINTLTKINKVTSGSTKETAILVDMLYKSIIKAGTHLAPSIKVAEASKAIENAQRDVNISFVNELALIFDRMNIDTMDVLHAAGTKWNFLKYRPGLVGGHCIGVDPYYLAHKAESLGYNPQVILSGRRVNDAVGMFIANKAIKLMIGKGTQIKGSRAIVLGVTFKENCPDTRNSKVFDIINELKQFGLNLDVYDPIANKDEVYDEYGIKLISDFSTYELILVAVGHNKFLELPIANLKKSKNSIVFDVKGIFDRKYVDARL